MFGKELTKNKQGEETHRILALPTEEITIAESLNVCIRLRAYSVQFTRAISLSKMI